MRFSVFLSTVAAMVALVVGIYHVTFAHAQQKLPATAPATATVTTLQTQTVEAQDEPAPQTPQTSAPTELSIPSINLTAPIIPVGLNNLGQMAVPSGSSDDVGWYDGGTVPGDVGSAVIDAHVFAAFSSLRYAKVGDDIYVTEGTTTLHFKITSSIVYKTADVPADTLFNKDDGRYLNLITCAGTYVPSQGTYDHRLVDYAVLVD